MNKVLYHIVYNTYFVCDYLGFFLSQLYDNVRGYLNSVTDLHN